MNKFKIILLAISLLVVGGCVDNKGEIRYCDVGDYAADDFTIALDYRIPEGDGPFPTIVFVHGGSWAAGDLSEYWSEIDEAASKGYTAVTVDYRLTAEKDENDKSKYPWDAQIEDVKCAIRFLKANAVEYKVDVDNIGVAGFSAGGHLALMAGMTTDIPRFEEEGQYQEFSASVNAVVAFSGPTDAIELYNTATPKAQAQKIAVDFMQGTPDEVPATYLDASPISYVDVAEIPILLMHGDTDTRVVIEQSITLVNLLDAAGHQEHPFIVYEGNPHQWAGEVRTHANANMFAFFDKHLKGDPSTPLSCSPYPSCEG